VGTSVVTRTVRRKCLSDIVGLRETGSVGLTDCPALSDCRALSGIARFMTDYIDGLTDRGSGRIDAVPSSDDLALSAPRPVTNRPVTIPNNLNDPE
jgi:hypothetical protein